MIADWNVPMVLVTPEGTLYLNESSQAEGYYVLDKRNCRQTTGIRATRNPVPQAPGAILHRGFTDGALLELAVEYWAGVNETACATSSPTSQSMDDLLLKHLRSILNGGGRLIWTPAGEPVRLLDELRWVETTQLVEDDGLTGTSFGLASPFPYGIDYTQTLTVLTSSSPTQTLTNTGTAPMYPVFKVYGPFYGFELENASNLDDDGNPLRIVYDSDLPGAVSVAGGHYIEIDTFRNTVYLDGDGASRKAGIDIEASDFWDLIVGDNEVTISGQAGSNVAPDVDILWQAAWQ